VQWLLSSDFRPNSYLSDGEVGVRWRSETAWVMRKNSLSFQHLIPVRQLMWQRCASLSDLLRTWGPCSKTIYCHLLQFNKPCLIILPVMMTLLYLVLITVYMFYFRIFYVRLPILS
jgi:hypothetical protein